jgi:hypothetical protein
MAFKMKGMSFGKGTGYKSPQAMKKEAAMKMKKAAMKMKDPMDMKKDPMMMKKDPMMMKKDPMMMKKDPMKMKKNSAMDMKKDPMKMKKGSAMKKDIKVNDDISIVTSGPDAGKVKSKKQTGAKNYAAAVKKDPKLPEYIKQRKGLKKGTKEYATVQNKINKAYGVSKRHSVATTTKSTNRSQKTTTTTPGEGSKTSKVVTDKKGTTRKIKDVERDDAGNVTRRRKQKFDKDGNRIKAKTVSREGDTVTKTIVKDKNLLSEKGPARVRTRKKGGTGIGSAIKGAIARRKARRANR